MQSSIKSDLQRFIDRLTSRSALSKEEQEAVLNLPGVPEHVQANRDFVRLGEHVEHACLVTSGLVGRFDQNSGEQAPNHCNLHSR